MTEKEKQAQRHIPRLLSTYRDIISQRLMERFGYKNRLRVPRLKQVVINMGVGAAAADFKILEQAANELAVITGQKPVITRAKKAIANFKIRKGQPIGCKVTLHGFMMYEFIDRLISVALPRIKDFRGMPKDSFDGGGNYTFGVSEQLIFPEVDYDKVQKVQGMDISISTTARTNEEAHELLSLLGFPFREAK